MSIIEETCTSAERHARSGDTVCQVERSPSPPTASHFGGITPVHAGVIFLSSLMTGRRIRDNSAARSGPNSFRVCAPSEWVRKFPRNLLPAPSFESEDEHVSCTSAFNDRGALLQCCMPLDGGRHFCNQLGLFTIAWTSKSLRIRKFFGRGKNSGNQAMPKAA
jgi:hypothetical protein